MGVRTRSSLWEKGVIGCCLAGSGARSSQWEELSAKLTEEGLQPPF